MSLEKKYVENRREKYISVSVHLCTILEICTFVPDCKIIDI